MDDNYKTEACVLFCFRDGEVWSHEPESMAFSWQLKIV